MTDYLTTDTELTSVANAIRTKGGTSEQLVYPTGFVSAIEAIPTGGGGDETLYIFSDVGYLNVGAMVSNIYLSTMSAFYGPGLVAGATVTIYTYGDYVLDTVSGMTSGESIPFTTVSRGNYTFTMPSESVRCLLNYDD